MLHDAFGEHSLRRTAVFEWHSHFKTGRVSVEDDECSEKLQKMLKKFENSSTKTVAEQFMGSQTPLGSIYGVCQEI
jgi:hypothetical protein